MSFFQNVFNQEFRGNWVLADRKLSLTFSCPANTNSSRYQLAHNSGPWDFSSTGSILSFNYSLEPNLKQYAILMVDVAGVDVSSTKPLEVVNALNADPTFNSIWTAELNNNSVLVRSLKDNVKVWISNSGAERAMRFNKYAGVAELPSYFERHSIENANNYEDSVGQLILLDETDLVVDAPIIEEAGFDPAAMKGDWELLRGRGAGLFTFQKVTVDGSDRITEIIEYPAGASEGDFARKIKYSYTGSNKNPTGVTESPYVLQSGDLLTP